MTCTGCDRSKDAANKIITEEFMLENEVKIIEKHVKKTIVFVIIMVVVALLLGVATSIVSAQTETIRNDFLAEYFTGDINMMQQQIIEKATVKIPNSIFSILWWIWGGAFIATLLLKGLALYSELKNGGSND